MNMKFILTVLSTIFLTSPFVEAKPVTTDCDLIEEKLQNVQKSNLECTADDDGKVTNL